MINARMAAWASEKSLIEVARMMHIEIRFLRRWARRGGDRHVAATQIKRYRADWDQLVG